ncbi:hypothetical protein T439DRAFT_321216 [Meredithblackwellia eburnea MCA 4105]
MAAEDLKRSIASAPLWSREEIRRTFIDRWRGVYGMGKGDAEFQEQREREYPALKDTIYLDHAASPPAPLSALNAFTTAMSKTLFSNPHSRSTSSLATSHLISNVRSRVLADLFGLDTPDVRERWDLVFTSGATASLKLVADSFPWRGKEDSSGTGARYRYLKEAHTSLVGIRACALGEGAEVAAMDSDEVEGWLSSVPSGEVELVGYPAQCNATGARLGCELGRRVKRRDAQSSVLLDASAYLATSPLDLSSIPFAEAPDFIVCSFYKLFGYPTGLGCLLVKLSSTGSARLSSKKYFGGGTIDAVSVDSPFWAFIRRAPSASPASPISTHSTPSSSLRSSPILSSESSSSRQKSSPPTSVSSPQPLHSPIYSPIHEALEDGTLPFLSIIGLNEALTTYKSLYSSLSAISSHTSALISFAREQLLSLQHGNGAPVVTIHSAFRNLNVTDYGSAIAFTVSDPSGKPVGHVDLDRLATINSFQLRTGGLCNTGVMRQVGELEDTELLESYHQGRRCWDDEEFFDADRLRPLGLSRISFGACSTVDDVLDWVQFIRKYFLISKEVLELSQSSSSAVFLSQTTSIMQTIVLYPIKSCGGQRLLEGQRWEVLPTGLAFDREWMLVSPSTGQTLSQKRFPRMALIRPTVDLASRSLVVSAVGMEDLILSLETDRDVLATSADVCGEVVSVHSSTSAVDAWFSTFLGIACRLHRVPPGGAGRHGHFDRAEHPVPILLSNESPFLLISQDSVSQVNEWIAEDAVEEGEGCDPSEGDIDGSCFRANFLISGDGATPFFEDGVGLLKVGDEDGPTFQLLARCRRCLMVCVDQQSGKKTKEPFSCLAKNRKSTRGRIEFGVHLMWRQDLARGPRAVTVGLGDRIIIHGSD